SRSLCDWSSDVCSSDLDYNSSENYVVRSFQMMVWLVYPLTTIVPNYSAFRKRNRFLSSLTNSEKAGGVGAAAQRLQLPISPTPRQGGAKPTQDGDHRYKQHSADDDSDYFQEECVGPGGRFKELQSEHCESTF